MINQLQVYKQNEVKPSRWIKLKEQSEFVSFLRNVGYNKTVKSWDKGKTTEISVLEKLDWCASVVEKRKCTQDKDHSIHVKYRLCGQRGVCPRCSMAYAHKRAMITYSWIKNNLAINLDFDLKMNQIVLTLPNELHDMNRKLFVKMIKEMMKKMEIESWGYVIQDDHSQNPLSSTYLHAHILSLNMKEENGKIVQNDYFFDVKDMREKWKSIIEKNTGLKVSGNVNLNSSYASVLNDSPRVLHDLAYCYRYPITDLFNVQVRNKTRDYDRTTILNYVQTQQNEKPTVPSILQINLANRIEKMTKSKPRMNWCGWLTSAKRERLKDMLKEPDEPMVIWNNMKHFEWVLDEKSKQCRDCGQLLEEKPFEICEYTGDNEPDLT